MIGALAYFTARDAGRHDLGPLRARAAIGGAIAAAVRRLGGEAAADVLIKAGLEELAR